MIKIVIYGLNITVSTNNIHIDNSYTIERRADMKIILQELKEELINNSITMDTPFNRRSTKSMINEWVAHNNLYKLGYKPERTKDVDINTPQPCYITVAYWLLSRIVL